jgi:hypothetical protein
MAGGLRVTFQQIVIHKIGEILNSCIIKTPASPVPADHPLKTRLFGHRQNGHQTTRAPSKSLQSRTAWGPFFERKTRKMSPHGGRLKRAFNAKTIGI